MCNEGTPPLPPGKVPSAQPPLTRTLWPPTSETHSTSLLLSPEHRDLHREYSVTSHLGNTAVTGHSVRDTHGHWTNDAVLRPSHCRFLSPNPYLHGACDPVFQTVFCQAYLAGQAAVLQGTKEVLGRVWRLQSPADTVVLVETSWHTCSTICSPPPQEVEHRDSTSGSDCCLVL